jgi:hypothetical protein
MEIAKKGLPETEPLSLTLCFYIKVKDFGVFRVDDFAVLDDESAKHFPITGTRGFFASHTFSFLGPTYPTCAPPKGRKSRSFPLRGAVDEVVR